MNFEIDEQQRDFAASIDAALGAADLPAAVRAWAAGDTAPGRKVWAQLADLGVTALAVPEKYDGIEAHPVDIVVALERLGRWCVPGPVAESIAVAPVLLADNDRSAALASGDLIATVALPLKLNVPLLLPLIFTTTLPCDVPLLVTTLTFAPAFRPKLAS